ncbi:MAG: IS3 family transposase [Butyricicoccus sp.]
MNTIRNNLFHHSASRMITRSQNHSSHRFVEKEELYRKDHPSDRAFQASVASYIEFYNSKRPHHILKNMTLYQMEESFCATVK